MIEQQLIAQIGRKLFAITYLPHTHPILIKSIYLLHPYCIEANQLYQIPQGLNLMDWYQNDIIDDRNNDSIPTTDFHTISYLLQSSSSLTVFIFFSISLR